jgi:hypothetical protein
MRCEASASEPGPDGHRVAVMGPDGLAFRRNLSDCSCLSHSFHASCARGLTLNHLWLTEKLLFVNIWNGQRARHKAGKTKAPHMKTASSLSVSPLEPLTGMTNDAASRVVGLNNEHDV